MKEEKMDGRENMLREVIRKSGTRVGEEKERKKGGEIEGIGGKNEGREIRKGGWEGNMFGGRSREGSEGRAKEGRKKRKEEMGNENEK